MDVSSVIAVVGFIISICVQVALIARWSGRTSAQITAIQSDIKRLEVKQDKSNEVKERLAVCEDSLRQAHHRITEVRDAK